VLDILAVTVVRRWLCCIGLANITTGAKYRRCTINTLKRCNQCEHQNPYEATLCRHCSTPLVPLLTARVTPVVPKEGNLPTPQSRDQYSDKLQPEECAFLVLGQHEPIVLRSTDSMMLGRCSPGEPVPAVDLGVFDGALYGVSRQHAVVKRAGKGYSIQDMESRNGTWVNERRLLPHEARALVSGDIIRLGQLGVYIYFKEAVAVPSCTLLLEDESAPHGVNLTPEYLRDVVSPYLMALAEVQDVAQQMRKKNGVLMVKTMSSQSGKIEATLEYAEDAVRFAETAISQWRITHAAELRHVQELNELSKWMVGDEAQERIYVKREQHRMVLQPELLQLALKFLDRVSMGTLHLSIASQIDRLIAAFWIIALSPLRVKQAVPEAIP
jgi:ribosomal protein L40E